MQTIITLSGIKKLFSNNNTKRVLKRRKRIYDSKEVFNELREEFGF